jgi:hypothetical protein
MYDEQSLAQAKLIAHFNATQSKLSSLPITRGRKAADWILEGLWALFGMPAVYLLVMCTVSYNLTLANRLQPLHSVELPINESPSSSSHSLHALSLL